LRGAGRVGGAARADHLVQLHGRVHAAQVVGVLADEVAGLRRRRLRLSRRPARQAGQAPLGAAWRRLLAPAPVRRRRRLWRGRGHGRRRRGLAPRVSRVARLHLNTSLNGALMSRSDNRCAGTCKSSGLGESSSDSVAGVLRVSVGLVAALISRTSSS